MDITIRLTPGLALHQRITPQLIQFMRLVALPCAELQKEVQDALVDYPALEEWGMENADTREPSRPEPRADDEAEWLRYLNAGAGRDLSRLAREREPASEEADFPERAPVRTRSLAAHLHEQLHEEYDDPRSRGIGEWIIASLDSAGYLDDDAASIASRLGLPADAVSLVLDRIRRFDPVGVATRGARESLMVQARVRFPDRPNLVRLIEQHLPALKAGRYSAIARSLGVAPADVIEEETRLLALDPRPARGFGEDVVQCVIPDVSVVAVEGHFVVRVNDDGLPRLRLSACYRRILEHPDAHGGQERAFARAKVTAAKAFLRNLYERQRTIRRVTESIVRLQHDFFERGPGHLRPLTLRDVAEDIHLADNACLVESTVSRATAGKYVDTPHGIFELKRFFGGGLPAEGGGEAVAVDCVKRRLGGLIDSEDPAHPLSDQQIAARLATEGITLARRTVTKYREALGVDSSHVRRLRRTRRDASPAQLPR